jgi:hypothetical protein
VVASLHLGRMPHALLQHLRVVGRRPLRPLFPRKRVVRLLGLPKASLRRQMTAFASRSRVLPLPLLSRSRSARNRPFM